MSQGGLFFPHEGRAPTGRSAEPARFFHAAKLRQEFERNKASILRKRAEDFPLEGQPLVLGVRALPLSAALAERPRHLRRRRPLPADAARLFR